MKINYDAFRYDKRRQQYDSPKGQLGGTFEQLQAAGCIQCENEQLRILFRGIQAMTKNNICDGCPVWQRKGPECAAFNQYHSAAITLREAAGVSLEQATKPQANSTNPALSCKSMRQIATELGISLSEARRRKAAGTL